MSKICCIPHDTPLISVVMSVYNDAKYIKESINSILNQTYKNIEVIIIDDASSDNSYDILKAITDDRILLLRNKKNRKLAYNMNKSIELAKGEYIARMDADDIAAPNRLETQVAYMESHPDIDILGSYVQIVGTPHVRRCPLHPDEIKVNMLFENPLCHPSVMFRTKTMDYRYDDSFLYSQDYELWSRVIWEKKIANLDKVLLYYRVHNEQASKANLNTQKVYAAYARINMLEHLFERPSEDLVTFFNSVVCETLIKKSRFQMKQIEDMLQGIITENERRMVFNQELLKQKAERVFFQNWYFSFNYKDVGVKCINDSILGSCYKTSSLKEKMRFFIKGFLNLLNM